MATEHKFAPSCRLYMQEGKCKFGKSCKFSHDGSSPLDDMKKPPVCRKFLKNGYCEYGLNCKFLHDDTADKFSKSPILSSAAVDVPIPPRVFIWKCTFTERVFDNFRVSPFTISWDATVIASDKKQALVEFEKLAKKCRDWDNVGMTHDKMSRLIDTNAKCMGENYSSLTRNFD